ncbi:hypothetical protein RRF57_011782 [Xylaria bambusicola]|uniref:Cytochrome P450 n=1 Tax=Xylaria bambusicola TaxID=326684 RepID=A0AAN7UNF1_9PEZI
MECQVIKRTGNPFVMRWWGMDYVFLPPKYLYDLKRAHPRDLNFFENISTHGPLPNTRLMLSRVRLSVYIRLMGGLLTFFAAKIIPLLDAESGYALSIEIGAAKNWKPFVAADLCGKIMHRTTSRILIGPELCRSDPYLKASETFMNSIFIHGFLMSMLPLRDVLHNTYDLIFTRFHRRHLYKAMEIILPVVEARFGEFQARASKNEAELPEYLDAIEWSLQFTRGNKKEHDPYWITLALLHNIWAGSAAPGGLVTQMLFQVLMEPQHLEPLRLEASRALQAGGYTDKALGNMPLMDSLIREINRVYPTGAITCARTVTNTEGFLFHDGLHLPQGTKIAVPALAIQTDAEHFNDPLTVDAFRFSRLREAANYNHGEGENNWSATRYSETNLAFGFGKHACPGRFYAVYKAKLIFSKLIQEYDWRWESPEVRPPSLSINGQFAPNRSQQIFLRQRGITDDI